MAQNMTNTIGAMVRRDIAPEDVVAHAVSLASSFDELWVVEDLPFAGGISQMTAILEATEDVVVGHGIAPAPFRTAAGLAMEWATLERLYPGRVACGLGHGVQSWMGQLGEKVDSPLTLIRETCDVVRALLAPATAPLVSFGVVGPKSLELSGEVADGTILPEGHGPVEIASALQRIETGQSQVGCSNVHRMTVFAAFHVGDESDIVRNPEAPVGWEAVGADPAAVAAELATLFEAGAHSVVLVPLAADPIAALEHAMADVVPAMRRAMT